MRSHEFVRATWCSLSKCSGVRVFSEAIHRVADSKLSLSLMFASHQEPLAVELTPGFIRWA